MKGEAVENGEKNDETINEAFVFTASAFWIGSLWF